MRERENTTATASSVGEDWHGRGHGPGAFLAVGPCSAWSDGVGNLYYAMYVCMYSTMSPRCSICLYLCGGAGIADANCSPLVVGSCCGRVAIAKSSPVGFGISLVAWQWVLCMKFGAAPFP
jgi:hypothetical protein